MHSQTIPTRKALRIALNFMAIVKEIYASSLFTLLCACIFYIYYISSRMINMRAEWSHGNRRLRLS